MFVGTELLGELVDKHLFQCIAVYFLVELQLRLGPTLERVGRRCLRFCGSFRWRCGGRLFLFFCLFFFFFFNRFLLSRSDWRHVADLERVGGQLLSEDLVKMSLDPPDGSLQDLLQLPVDLGNGGVAFLGVRPAGEDILNLLLDGGDGRLALGAAAFGLQRLLEVLVKRLDGGLMFFGVGLGGQ